ncbi:MAG TPA: hypothetical protein EYG92_04535 [Lutibacter sp.]|nr:hypothetical protein [Lutibacter sp.]
MQIRIFIVLLAFVTFYTSFSQTQHNLSIGFESNSQYYVDDSVTGDFEEGNPFRSNNYLKVDYGIGSFKFGVQAEGYVPQYLLNYSPKYDQQINVGTYYGSYTTDKFDITLGHFYGQFGNGLIFRAWEDRQLGINNALRGAKVFFQPTERISFTALYGQQRVGFKVSDGNIYGLDSNFDLSTENTSLQIGVSFVNRYHNIVSNNPNFNPDTKAYSYRLQFAKNSFYANVESAFKTKDAYKKDGVIYDKSLFYGNALLLEFGYSQKGFGLTTTLRRLENMSFYSDREVAGNLFNEQIVNYIPGLTKQHDYLLTNLYVYQAQPNLSITATEQKAGEIGGQIDLYYKFKKGSALGGKYGTKIAANYSHWFGLDASYNTEFKRANVTYFGKGELYFKDVNIEIRKKLSKKLSGILTFVNSTYNRKVLEGEKGMIESNVLVTEATYKMSRKQSLRLELQHLWSEGDLAEVLDDGTEIERKNWVAGTAEFNVNSHFSLFANDMFNYSYNKEHYYNVGGSYTKNKSRFALSYGRTRGGLLCVGGVCRIVPAATGLTFNLTTSF